MGASTATLQRRTVIQRLWADGYSIRGIAEVVGRSPNAVQVEIHRMRAAGLDVPYRYRRRFAEVERSG